MDTTKDTRRREVLDYEERVEIWTRIGAEDEDVPLLRRLWPLPVGRTGPRRVRGVPGDGQGLAKPGRGSTGLRPNE